jgi:hypothetical protein
MTWEAIGFGVLAVGWIVVMRWVLPRFGVGT